jgi:hypothetical protein
LIGVSNEINELEGLRTGRTDAMVVSDPQELGTRAMQAMRAALSGSDSQSFSTELPVSLVDAQSMPDNAIVGMLYRQRD